MFLLVIDVAPVPICAGLALERARLRDGTPTLLKLQTNPQIQKQPLDPRRHQW